jgi:hypothetical protein
MTLSVWSTTAEADGLHVAVALATVPGGRAVATLTGVEDADEPTEVGRASVLDAGCVPTARVGIGVASARPEVAAAGCASDSCAGEAPGPSPQATTHSESRAKTVSQRGPLPQECPRGRNATWLDTPAHAKPARVGLALGALLLGEPLRAPDVLGDLEPDLGVYLVQRAS